MDMDSDGGANISGVLSSFTLVVYLHQFIQTNNKVQPGQAKQD